MTRILALDLSLNGTGWAVGPNTYGTLDPKGRRGPERLSWIRDEILHLEHLHAVSHIALEGYAYGRPNQAHQIGELGGVIRTALYDAGIAYLEVAPSSLKRYATGKGNASKSFMLVQAVKRLGYDGESNDEADALWLHALVSDAVGAPWVEMPKAHREALAPVTADLDELGIGAAA